jgi:hypothetical protein
MNMLYSFTITPHKNKATKAIVKSLLLIDNELLKHVKQTGYP